LHAVRRVCAARRDERSWNGARAGYPAGLNVSKRAIRRPCVPGGSAERQQGGRGGLAAARTPQRCPARCRAPGRARRPCEARGRRARMSEQGQESEMRAAAVFGHGGKPERPFSGTPRGASTATTGARWRAAMDGERSPVRSRVTVQRSGRRRFGDPQAREKLARAARQGRSSVVGPGAATGRRKMRMEAERLGATGHGCPGGAAGAGCSDA